MQKNPSRPYVLRGVLIAVLSALAAGCGAPSQSTLKEVRDNSNPTDRPQRSITNFTPALRCMDDMMFSLGTRDITVMMEEFRDATQKLPLSARDMLTSALSDMTRRSRAVRLTVFGGDQANLTQFLQLAQKSNVFAVVPQYNIRGTISQLDETVKKSGGSVGISLIESAFGVRLGSDTKFSVLGLDTAMVDTTSMTLIPGVSSKNTTVLASRDANAGDGQAKLQSPNIGLVFSFDTSRADGPAQAARNMIELAMVELVGKLIRAPYWQCLGTLDSDPEVQREMDDWFLSSEQDELTKFYQLRMRERRYYDGAINGQADASFTSAMQTYRKAMGLPGQGALDQQFFKQFVTTQVARGTVAVARATPASAVPASAAQPTSSASAAALPVVPVVVDAAAPLAFTLAVIAQNTQLKLEVKRPGYVYCYTQDPVTRQIQRIFPNRFVQDPRVEPGRPVALPGQGRFVLNPAAEYACLHAPREIYSELPPPLRWGDFEDIKLKSFEDIRQQFSQSAGLPVQMVSKRMAARR